jgi:carboxymethylenebutenolidase
MQEFFSHENEQIRLQIYEPTPTTTKHPAIILLHGSGGNVARWAERFAPHLNRVGIALYAPHYFDRTHTGRASQTDISDGIHVPLWLGTLRATLAHITVRPNVDPKRIALVGVSLGAFLSLAFAAENSTAQTPIPIRCLVDLSGGLIEPFASQATASFPPTLILHGDTDKVVSVNYARDLDKQLTTLNVPHELHILPHEDHWFSPVGALQLLAHLQSFLTKHL